MPLRGIIPPMVTPLVDRDTLDAAGLERLVEHLIDGGVHGIFILGTTGEAPSLSYRLRQDLIERVCRHVSGRVPVLVGVTDTSFVESVNLARHAAQAGAQAVVLSAPYYFPAGQPELLEYVQDIAGELPLPVFLYNMPSHTKLTFEPDTIRKALEIPNIVGLKDSSAQMIYFHKLRQLVADRRDFSLLVGPEELLGESVLLGGHGGVCGGANLFPRLYVDLYQAASAAQLDRIASLHARVMRLGETIYSVGQHRSAFIKGLKCGLSCLGICDDFMAEPFQRFGPDQRKQIQKYLADLGVSPSQRALQTAR
ncbi:MAG: dihydrodipicolinate synthase family protein [Planctomycetia bacterium]|nr:dihydrodipicolinate synthase family protein [Planctomycetia bacterium]